MSLGNENLVALLIDMFMSQVKRNFQFFIPTFFASYTKWHKGWCNWFALSYGAPFVVYLSLSSDPHVSFVPKPTWPSDYLRFSTT
jgi:hypothetical protein